MLPNKTVGILLLVLGAFLIIAGIFCVLEVEHFNFENIFGYSIMIAGTIIILFALWFYFIIKLHKLSDEHAAKKAAKRAAARKAKEDAKAASAKPGESYASKVNLGDSNLAKAIRRGAEVTDAKLAAGKIDAAAAKAKFDAFMAYAPKVGTPEEDAATIEVAQMIGFLSKA